MLLRPKPDFYASRDAGSEDVLLLIEVADITLAYDRNVKLPLYGCSGVPEVWIVDLNGRAVLVCRDPGPQGYGGIDEIRGTNPVSPQAFPDLQLPAAQILA